MIWYGVEADGPRTGTLAGISLRQAAHGGAQPEILRQVRGETTHAQGLAGVEPYLTPGEVREDSPRGKDGILTLQAYETFAPAQPLLAGGVEAGLSSSRAANGQPVPVEDERLVPNSQNTLSSDLRFRVLLTEGGAEQLELARI